jgi:hypothetical protein
MRQLQLFTPAELAGMRDRTASRNYSPEGEEFRREHARHRAWGLIQRHNERLRRLRVGSSASPTANARNNHPQEITRKGGYSPEYPIDHPAPAPVPELVPAPALAPAPAPELVPTTVPTPTPVQAAVPTPVPATAAVPTPVPATAAVPPAVPTSLPGAVGVRAPAHALDPLPLDQRRCRAPGRKTQARAAPTRPVFAKAHIRPVDTHAQANPFAPESQGPGRKAVPSVPGPTLPATTARTTQAIADHDRPRRPGDLRTTPPARSRGYKRHRSPTTHDRRIRGDPRLTAPFANRAQDGGVDRR